LGLPADIDVHLERLNRLACMGAVTGMIAHEFNNILTPILSYAQMALEEPGNSALSAKALERTVAGAERAARIADAILSFVREQVVSTSETCEVGVVVAESLSCLARRTTEEGGRASVRVPAGLRAAMDGIRLQQVLVNLLLNARAAMGDREGDLTIEAEEMAGAPETPVGAADSRAGSSWNTESAGRVDAGAVVIRLRDRGPGMSAERLAGLFTPFRTDSNAKFHRGTGLGMTVCSRLLQDAGGWMFVESSVGVGTTVSIVVPAACENTNKNRS
jgi:C4-dicarboxylate-specific signal transduction histidine kinase